MTSYTITQLGTRALKDIGLVAAEETPSSVDLNWSIETCQAEIETMAWIGINIWDGSQYDIPLAYLTPLSRRCGIPMSVSYGLISVADAIAAIPVAENVLRMLGQKPATGEVQTAEHF